MDWQKFGASLAIGAVSVLAWNGVGSLLGESASMIVRYAVQTVAVIVSLLVFNYIVTMINPSFFGGGVVSVPPSPPTKEGPVVQAPAGATNTATNTTSNSAASMNR